MKKSVSQFLAAALISTAVLSPALKADATNASFGGLQLGLVGGLSFINGHTSDMKTKDPATGNLLRPGEKEGVWNLGGRGGAFGLFLGYGAVVGQVYVGADIVYTRDFTNSNFRTYQVTSGPFIYSSVVMNLKLKDSLEIAARFGVPTGNWMPYVRLGWTSSKVVGKINPYHENIHSQPEQKFLDKRLSGFLVGVGVDGQITKCFLIGLEGGYKRFSNAQTETMKMYAAVNPDGTPNAASLFHRDAKVSLSGSYVRLKLVYNFSM